MNNTPCFSQTLHNYMATKSIQPEKSFEQMKREYLEELFPGLSREEIEEELRQMFGSTCAIEPEAPPEPGRDAGSIFPFYLN